MAITAVAVLALHLIRPPAEGALVVQGGAAVDASLRQATPLRSLDLLRSIVFQKATITVEADRISLSKPGPTTFSSVRIEPIESSAETQVSQDLSPALARRLTFKVRPAG